MKTYFTLFCLVFFPAQLCFAQPNYYREIKWGYETHGFSQSELRILGGAVRLVSERFLDPKIAACAYRNATKWRMRGDYLRKAGRKVETFDAFKYYVDKIQMSVLREKGFPELTIMEFNENSNTTGLAFQKDIAILKYVTPTNGFSLRAIPKVVGRFKVYVNVRWLGSSDTIGNDEAYWAGTIAHEMLHNIGHHHKKGEYDGLFIREFENCLAANGNYRRGFSLVQSNRFEN